MYIYINIIKYAGVCQRKRRGGGGGVGYDRAMWTTAVLPVPRTALVVEK